MDLVEITKNSNRHPWEISRTKKLVELCTTILKNKKSVHICDIGAGDRYFEDQLLLEFEKMETNPIIYAVDINYLDLRSDSDRIQLHKSISTITREKMDLIVMMDVLEHVENDLIFLQQVLNRLEDDGVLLITVPAHSFLFSSHDIFLKHYRRYDLETMISILNDCKLNIQKCHYFYTSLFIVRWLKVKLQKDKPIIENVGIGKWKYPSNNIITFVITILLNFDFSINTCLDRIGIRLPGLSILCVAKK